MAAQKHNKNEICKVQEETHLRIPTEIHIIESDIQDMTLYVFG